MTYNGHIRNGVAVLDTPITLPEGTPVRVEVELAEPEFWQGRNVEELARAQGVQPCTDPGDLAGDWPPEDSIDDFLALVKRSRL